MIKCKISLRPKNKNKKPDKAKCGNEIAKKRWFVCGVNLTRKESRTVYLSCRNRCLWEADLAASVLCFSDFPASSGLALGDDTSRTLALDNEV